MKKLFICIAFALAIPLAFGNAFAQSAKATAAVDELVALNVVMTAGPEVIGAWTTILTQEIKTANMKDLFIDVSLETGLYTDTLVRSKDDVLDESTAVSAIRVRVGAFQKSRTTHRLRKLMKKKNFSKVSSGLLYSRTAA